MSYIDKSLGAGETVITRARFPWTYNLSAWCQLLIPALVLAGLLVWASRQPNFLATNSPLTWAAALGGGGNMESGDDLYDQALAVVARDKKASTSYIQRRLQIGYNRAASLIERMEQDGVISAPNHKGVREVLLPDHER